ncbi:HAD family hydrolase [Granulosicoccus sp. 3-233]|uniref:HAD family hydrolase n=1 Tax=Granulosicoccus sp. 3-233 TaxID=3417969 RepID=UPI003D3251A5
MNIAATIFDMDGLLIDSERIALSTFQNVCDQHELGDQFALYLQLLGTTDATSKSILQERLPAHLQVDQFMQTWTGLYVEQTSTAVPLMTGVLALLDHLDAIGMARSVATSTRTDHAIGKLRNSGILHRFAHVTGGDQVAQGKPAPDIYLKAAQRLGVEPAHCLALEDSPNGVRAALSAGMQVIQIPSLVQPDAEFRTFGHTILEDLHRVIDFLNAHPSPASMAGQD